jgi:hypothetical protein
MQKAQYLFVVKTRPKHHQFRANANKFKEIRKRPLTILPSGKKAIEKGRIRHTNDPGGYGAETEKEFRVCLDCFIQLTENFGNTNK